MHDFLPHIGSEHCGWRGAALHDPAGREQTAGESGGQDTVGRTIIRANEQFLFTGDTQGNITLRDPKTFEAIHSLEAHKGAVLDFDVCGMKLVSCGLSYRMPGQLQGDRFLMLFDLRTLRAQRPVALNFEPSFIRFLPTYSDNRLVVASQSGEFQVFEIGEANTYPFHVETQGTGIFCMDVSPSKQCVALGDGAGFLHLFSDRAEPVINECPKPTVFADPIQAIPGIPFDDLITPYSVVPFPLPQDGKLLSDWPAHLCRRVNRIPLPMDPEILKSMRVSQFVGYAPNPGNMRRNQVPYDLNQTGASSGVLFSDGASGGANEGAQLSTAESFSNKNEETVSQVPKKYRRMTVKPGKFGGDESLALKFWRNYNRTPFSGLESLVPNAYCNAVVLILYHIVPLRNCILSHLCRNEFCLTCELSFVFKMLSQGAGKQPVLSNNFIRAFRAVPEASALDLVLNDREDLLGSKEIPWAGKIQSFNRFLLQQLHRELEPSRGPGPRVPGVQASIAEEDTPSSPSKLGLPAHKSSPIAPSTPIEELFSAKIRVSLICCKCGHASQRKGRPLVLSLFYPEDKEKVEFSKVVADSFCRKEEVQSWCDICATYQSSQQAKTVDNLPNIMAINMNAGSDKHKQFLENQHKLWPISAENSDFDESAKCAKPEGLVKPCRFGASCNRPDCRFQHKTSNGSQSDLNSSFNDNQNCSPLSDWIPARLRLSVDENGTVTNSEEECEGVIAYELGGVVFLIRETDQDHLVACVSPPTKQLTSGRWVVMNDFVVCEAGEAECLRFSCEWKVPAVLYYCRKELAAKFEKEAVYPIDDTVFWQDDCVSVRRRLSSSKFVPLEENEIPKKGDVVAIDAEFVTLNQDEWSDGNKGSTKPSQMSLARVSAIRGCGDMEGVPFLDDYISTQNQVADYLTKFSGIKPGDLDPIMTSKHLTTLKSSYLKLRYLADSGVVFVGHGLCNDFRVINIMVPSEQVRDTVHLFHLPNHRMISLRFLAWYFLDMKIQSETHDSIEDARTALRLYKKYLELSEGKETEFQNVLREMYEKAKSLEWKVPGD